MRAGGVHDTHVMFLAFCAIISTNTLGANGVPRPPVTCGIAPRLAYHAREGCPDSIFTIFRPQDPSHGYRQNPFPVFAPSAGVRDVGRALTRRTRIAVAPSTRTIRPRTPLRMRWLTTSPAIEKVSTALQLLNLLCRPTGSISCPNQDCSPVRKLIELDPRMSNSYTPNG